jgi:hypothetical protein
MVWVTAISQIASRVGEGGGVGQISIALHNLTLPGPGGESREGGGLRSLPLIQHDKKHFSSNSTGKALDQRVALVSQVGWSEGRRAHLPGILV